MHCLFSVLALSDHRSNLANVLCLCVSNLNMVRYSSSPNPFGHNESRKIASFLATNNTCEDHMPLMPAIGAPTGLKNRGNTKKNVTVHKACSGLLFVTP